MQKLMYGSLVGRQLGNYRIERLLGRGGMASVYYGVDIHLQRPAAIKVTDDRYRGDPDYAERFLREARAMASWRHPNIPQVYGAEAEGGFAFYAMEYIWGMDLEQLIEIYRRRNELIPPADVLRIAEAVGAALDYSHRKGAIHRDVKPSNILVARNGRIFLTDFGLLMEAGKETRGEVFGSPHYMAPEQARSSAGAVPQSDLYSLGVVLYELLAGRPPFDDPSPASLALKHITQEPPPPRLFNPGLSTAVEAVLLNALQKDPLERFQTGADLTQALKSALNNEISSPVLIQEDTPTVTNPFLQQEAAVGPQQTISKLQLKHVVNAENAEPPPTLMSIERDGGIETLLKVPGMVGLPLRKLGCALLVLAGLLVLISGGALASRYIFSSQGLPTEIAAGIPSETPLRFATYTPTLTPEPSPTPSPTPLPTNTPTTTPTATEPAPTSTLTATAAATSTATETAEPAATFTATQLPVVLAEEYELLLAKRKDDSLFVINQGSADIPLEHLQLGNSRGRVSGDEWEVRYLHPDGCVAIWKEEGKPQPPKKVRCEPVGERIERSGSEKFWTDDFEVLYKDSVVGKCKKKDQTCEIRFTPPP